MAVTVRSARRGDAPAIAAIYNAGIAERQATFETRPRDPAEVGAWFDHGLPFLVAAAGRQDGGREEDRADWARR